MPATLRGLLGQAAFKLKVIAGAPDGASVFDEPLSWAHSSDLADPTPWLESGQLLLTDGVQFTGDQSAETVEPYVQRLEDRGIRALGFAVGIAHPDVPPALIVACDAHRLPLIEVPARTPFMGIIRYIADVISAEQRERLEWSLQAQRAVARAALRPDGLGAILLELERQLDCWVALFDAVGDRVHVETRVPMPAAIEEAVEGAVREALARGTRAGVRLNVDGGGATLQTLGQRNRLRGILAVGTVTPLDTAGSDLVASVIGLASIALEQSSNLETARLRLRAGVLELLLSGIVDVAGQTARRLWGRLPSAPIRVAVLSWPQQGQSLLEELELYADRHHGRLFFAERDAEVIAIVRHDDPAGLETILGRHEMGAGFSGPIAWDELPSGLDEARKASRRASAARPFVRFETLADEGMLGLLDASGAENVARRMLQPLLESADADQRALLTTAAVWLEHNGAWDPAARALHIHRHTLRNRIQTVEGALGIDLDRFSDRAELWAALQFVDHRAEG